MGARMSVNGKRLGRPPGTPQATLPPQTPDASTLAIAKAMQTFRARYDAAGRGRRMAGWNPPSTGPNAALNGLQNIRDRSRDAGRNDWSGESSTQKWTTALIGIGIRARFPRIKDKDRRQFVSDLFDDFMRTCDADGVLHGYAQQTLATRSWVESGEVFARRRARFPDEGLPLPFQIQLLEAEMCPLLDTDNYKGLPIGHFIRSGIELDKRGKRIAYWFYKQHPGDNKNVSNIGADELIRVAASEVIHMFEQKRPGQLRGVPMIASVLPRLRNVGDYEDATLERQKLANLWVGFITRTLPTMDPNDPNVGALTGLEQDVGGDGAGLQPLKPGLIQELEDGQNFNFANPPEAGTTYSDYIRTSHLGTAAAAGIPYELFSGDIREISDRTLRVLVNEFRRFAEQRQWQIVIAQYCQRVVDWFSESAAVAGLITIEEATLVRRCEHAPHGWAYIHPTQDVQGKAMEVKEGFRSRSSVISERGDDPDAVDTERAEDFRRNEGLGLIPAGAQPVAPVEQPVEPPPQETPPAPAPTPQQTRASLAEISRIEAQTELLRAQAKRALDQPEPSPVDENQLAFQNRILDLLG